MYKRQGKDILRFHTIYWPIMLMALDLPLPKKVFGHPWMLFGKDKMSKSRGNVIYADDLANQFGVDAVRYYMISEMPYAQDGAITYETVIARYNADLANTLGNLVNRTVSMCHKYFGGTLEKKAPAEAVDQELAAFCLDTVEKYQKLMDDLHLADAVDCVMNLARRANKYIDETMPWALAKDEANRGRLMTVMFCLTEAIRQIAVLLQPFMPDTAAKIFSQIGSSLTSVSYTHLIFERVVLFSSARQKQNGVRTQFVNLCKNIKQKGVVLLRKKTPDMSHDKRRFRYAERSSHFSGNFRLIRIGARVNRIVHHNKTPAVSLSVKPVPGLLAACLLYTSP